MNTQQLYVGANYHPHDDINIEKIRNGIQLMKNVGFNVVRMGHLACFDNNSDATKTEIQKITILRVPVGLTSVKKF